TNILTFTPAKPFFVGELVTAVATRKILYDSTGTNVPIHGFAWQFYGAVTKKTRVTFRDTAQLHTEMNHNILLTGLTDMDNDGNLDIIYAKSDSPAVVLFNAGDGLTFQKVGMARPGGMYVADYNLRGYEDGAIAFGGYAGGYIAQNNGNRTFNYGGNQKFAAYFNAQTVDIDFDGHPEIITEGFDQQGNIDTVNVYSVIGDSIILWQSIYVGDIGLLTVGDFNNDGSIDVCAAPGGILYNDGTGRLSPPKSAAYGGVAMDMDGDGWLDLAGPLRGLGTYIEHNNHDSTFTLIESLNQDIPFNNNTVSFGSNVADLDGDGLPDIIFTLLYSSPASMCVITEKNMGNDSMRVMQFIGEGNLGQNTSIYFADLFHEGSLDPVISYPSGEIHIYHNDSTISPRISPFSVDEQPATTPEGYVLNETFPNPSNLEATIAYTIPSTKTVSIGIYDINGQLVSKLVSGLVAEGSYTMNYDCSGLPSGNYFVELSASNTTLTKQFIVTH
ncbi:MAG TPA: T9SS type A sorting domain-containing protein, partial [Candidatus Kapabacteria bacterium]|nr:T9SS type A sorting domain-containing protein [Candidatus Kapabacteria bacterium]